MVWIYSIILAFSAGVSGFVLARMADRLTVFLGVQPLAQNVLGYAALAALAFLMVAQAPAMVLTSALVLWFAGTRHQSRPLGPAVQAGLLVLACVFGLVALPSPDFQLPLQLPKIALMGAVYAVWLLVAVLPAGVPDRGFFAAYGVGLVVFIVGAVAFALPTSVASDALVLLGALLGAYFSLSIANSHHSLAGQWVFLYLLGYLAALSAYHGAWWLGLLGIAPVAVYTLVRK